MGGGGGGGGAVRSVRDGRNSWAWRNKKCTSTVGPLTHPETVWIVRASHLLLEKYFSSTLLC